MGRRGVSVSARLSSASMGDPQKPMEAHGNFSKETTSFSPLATNNGQRCTVAVIPPQPSSIHKARPMERLDFDWLDEDCAISCETPELPTSDSPTAR